MPYAFCLRLTFQYLDNALRSRSRETRDDNYRYQKNHCAGKKFLPKIRIHDVPPFLRWFVLKEYFLGVGFNIRAKCKELMLISGQNCKCFVKYIALMS